MHHAPRSITVHQRVRASLRSPGGGGGMPRRAEDMHIAGTTPAVRRGRPTEPAAELAVHADVDLLDSLVALIAIYPPREGKGRRADCDRAGCVSSRRR